MLFLLHANSSLMLCTHAELHQSPYFIMHFKFFILYVKCVYELQDIGGDLHGSTLQMCIASKANSSLCTSSGGVLLYLAIEFLSISIYTSYSSHEYQVFTVTPISSLPKSSEIQSLQLKTFIFRGRFSL